MADLYDLILSISVSVTYSKLVRRVFFFRPLKSKKGMELSYCNDSTVTVVFIREAWDEYASVAVLRKVFGPVKVLSLTFSILPQVCYYFIDISKIQLSLNFH